MPRSNRLPAFTPKNTSNQPPLRAYGSEFYVIDTEPSTQIACEKYCALGLTSVALAETALKIRNDSANALQHLYAVEPSTKELGEKAVAVLVFPKIYKAGLMVDGEHGQGTLFKGKEPIGYYDLCALSFGLQAGAQTFGYALFFMNHKSLNYLEQSDGWALGSGPSLVVWDKYAASSISTTTLSQDVFAVPFGAQGLMAGMGLEGSKITSIKP